MTHFVPVRIKGSPILTAAVLAADLAEITDATSCDEVSKGDIVRLRREPSADDASPWEAEIILRRNPVRTEINFGTEAARDRMIALALALGAEVTGVLDVDEERNVFEGSIFLSHSEGIDMSGIARAAGVYDSLDYDPPPDIARRCGRPVLIPRFPWGRDDVRPFEGTCTGEWMSDYYGYEYSFVAQTRDGRCFEVTVDTRVWCVLPQYEIDGYPYDYPVVNIKERNARCDASDNQPQAKAPDSQTEETPKVAPES